MPIEINLPISFDALAIDEAGAPLQKRRKTISSLNDDEVLVRIGHASINKMDPGLARRNLFGLPTPYVLGFDFSGEVVRRGDGVRVDVGTQIFGGTATGGCFAEYVVAKQRHVLPRGPVPSAEASTYGIAYLTAYDSVMITGKLDQHAGKWIYVAGAAGGVGHFAAQMARLSGLKVIGTAGKPASLDLLGTLGLELVVDYRTQDVVGEIMRITGGKGVDLVYDSTYSQASYEQSTAVVAPGGDYIRLGTPQQLAMQGATDMTAAVEARGARMLVANLGQYGHAPVDQAMRDALDLGMRRAVSWYAEGRLRPMITERVPFDAGALQRAFDAFLKGKNNVVKVVVEVRPT